MDFLSLFLYFYLYGSLLLWNILFPFLMHVGMGSDICVAYLEVFSRMQPVSCLVSDRILVITISVVD